MAVCATSPCFHQKAFKPVHRASIKFDEGNVSKIKNSCKLYEKRKHIEKRGYIGYLLRKRPYCEPDLYWTIGQPLLRILSAPMRGKPQLCHFKHPKNLPQVSDQRCGQKERRKKRIIWISEV